MKVYIITQNWFDGYEECSDIIYVTDSKEKAVDKLKETYKDDVNWICESYDIDEDEFESNELCETYSFVKFDEIWSSNNIVEKELE